MAISSIPRAISSAAVQAAAEAAITAKLAAIQATVINDVTPFAGANLDKQLSTFNDIAVSDIPAGSAPFVWSAAEVNNYGIITGDWTRAAGASNWNGWKLYNSPTPTQHDSVALGNLYLPETANYTLYMVSRTNTTFGIAHFFLNGVDKGQIDTYSGSDLYNQVQSVSLGSLTKGLYGITLKVASKNGLSSGYYVYLQSILIAKT